jgi:hypothetical protein
VVTDATAKPGRRRSDREVRDRRFRLARLYWRGGASVDQLAAKFGIQKSQVYADLAAVRQHFRALLGPDRLEEIRVEVLADLDLVRGEALLGWRRSLRPASRVREKTATAGRSGRETMRQIEVQAGDPRFLTELRAAGQDLRDFLGLDAPRKVVTTPDGDRLPIVRIVNVIRPALESESIGKLPPRSSS